METTPSGIELEMPEDVERYLGAFGGVTSVQMLHGGMISQTRRLVTASGKQFVLKSSDTAPDGMYEAEADGLRALARAGSVYTPDVMRVSPGSLLVEDLGRKPARAGYWEEFGHTLALQHTLHNSERFGYDRDNYLGRLPQRNEWTDDGHTFFVHHRILRYLPEPLCEGVLSARDRRDLESIAARLPQLIPDKPASLLHGDLWFANMLAGLQGEPAFVDPAVHYGWAEAELSMVWMCGRVPDSFYAAYMEINPLEPGWQERMPLLHVRELLSMLAHFGNAYGSAEKLSRIAATFA